MARGVALIAAPVLEFGGCIGRVRLHRAHKPGPCECPDFANMRAADCRRSIALGEFYHAETSHLRWCEPCARKFAAYCFANPLPSDVPSIK